MTAAIINAPQQGIEPTNKREYYEILTDKEAEISKDCGKRYRSGSAKASEGLLEAGSALIEAKEKLGHGKFIQFCKYELPVQVSQDTVENLMNAAKSIKANPTLIKFNPSAIFTLSKKSTPPEVVQQLCEKAEAGEPLPTVAEIKETIAEVKKAQTPNIKKGDLVEWDIELKGYRYGKVAKKSTDGIMIKLTNLDGMPLGERPAKFVSLCPIQKRNEDAVNTYSRLKEGDSVVIKPYCSWLQEYTGRQGKVIHINFKKFLGTIMFDDGIKEFHWGEFEKVEQEKIQPQTQATIDVEATEVQPEEETTEQTEVEEKPHYINGLPVNSTSELEYLVNEIYARIEELDNTQIQFLLEGLKAEAVKRPWAKIKVA